MAQRTPPLASRQDGSQRGAAPEQARLGLIWAAGISTICAGGEYQEQVAGEKRAARGPLTKADKARGFLVLALFIFLLSKAFYSISEELKS